MLNEIIQIEARFYPEGNATTLMSVYYLAILRREQSKYRDAELLLNKILELNEVIPEKKRIDYFTIKNELANLYWMDARYEEAEALCIELLKEEDSIDKNILLKINQTMVDIYISCEEYEKAKEFCSKILATKKRLLGMKHPSTLVVANNLALIYLYMGEYTKAGSICYDVLLVQERVLPPGHLDILMTKSTLADIYKRRGNKEKAKELHREVLDSRTKKLGEEHHDTLESMNKLGLAYVSWEQFDKAGECLFEALLIAEGYTTENDVLGIAKKKEPKENPALFYTEEDDDSSGFFSSIFTFLGKKSKG